MSLSAHALVATLRPLRTFLAAVTVALIVTAPFALGESSYLDWRIGPTVIAPIIMVMMVFVLPLDMLMTLVFLSDPASPAERARLRRVLAIEAALLIAMLGAWTPFLLALAPD